MITHRLEQNIAQMPAVALLGARQVGKTTLAREMAKIRPAIYLDLEATDDLIKLSDPVEFLSNHRDKLVILDEIQRSPDLFMALRGIIDKNRAEGYRASQFLFLGSASMDLLKQTSESLAGRISYLEMSGFNLLEVPNTTKTMQALWFKGGFPDSYLAETDTWSINWLENLIRTYLERDIPQMGFRIPTTRLRRLWTMLAHMQGETINFSKLAANLDIDAKTVKHHIDILVDLLLVRQLSPWYANVKKRLIKSPRFYIRDSGILHRLLGIADYDALLSNPILGKSWEGFVIENILSILPTGAETYFYRTAVGAEIDLIVKFPNSALWAIEIKKSTTPQISKGFHQACEDIHATQKYVVYGGDDEFPMKNNITVISLRKLMGEINRLL